MKTDVHKPDINKLVSVPTNWNNLKSNVDDLDVGKLKTAPADLKKLNDVVSKEVVKNTKFNILNMKKIIRKRNSWCVYFNSDISIKCR